MTEGIIHKIITPDKLDSLYSYVHLNPLPEDLSPNEYVADMLRKELIDRIKNDLEYYSQVSSELDHIMNLPEIIKKLIGDNKQ